MAGEERPLLGDEAGVSLVELLVATSVFAIVLVGVTGVLISGVRSIGDQRLRTAATRVAVDHLETLRSIPFEELEAEAGIRTRTTPDGRTFKIETSVARIDAGTSLPTPGGRVKQITAVVQWVSGGVPRQVSYTTAIAGAPRAPQRSIGTVTMFPSPATVDTNGQPLDDIEVMVPLSGFSVGTLAQLSWSNADGTTGAKTLTSTSGLNWRGAIAKEQVRGAIGADGRGELEFRVTAESVVAVYTLALQGAVASPPTIGGVTVSHNPITVAKSASGRGCTGINQCQNTTEVTFRVRVTGLDPAQDSVVLQYQLYDGTFQEVPLAPMTGISGEWGVIVRQKTTKFRTGTARPFRLTAIRSADGATAGATVLRDVISI